MKCPECKGKSRVLDTQRSGEDVIRLRCCKVCGARFVTCEIRMEDEAGRREYLLARKIYDHKMYALRAQRQQEEGGNA